MRLWQLELQTLTDKTGLSLTVCHYPLGTSKWNRIEHRLFCHISQNWQTRPLTSRFWPWSNLIAATTKTTGLTVACELDIAPYEKGITVTKAEMADLNLHGDDFHPEWNYTLKPRSPI